MAINSTNAVQGAGVAALNPTVLGGAGVAKAFGGGRRSSTADPIRDSVNQRQSYLNGLSPTDLLSLYSGYSKDMGQGGNISDYLRSKIGVSTAPDETNYSAYQNAKSILGRDPTSNELAKILPAFQGPNGIMNGRAALANLADQYKSNPSLDPSTAQNNQKPGDIQGSVTQQFQSTLGRAPTADELAHFTQAIQSNQTDAYGLGSFLKQMPEYTNAQDSQFRSGLNSELQNYDTQEFNREKGDVISAYGKNGMAAGNSPSLDYALTDLMGKIASNRSSYLAQLSSSQYGGNKDLAVGNYRNTLDQMNQTHQQQTQQQSAYGSQLTNQGFAGADYQTQMNNFMNYMNSQPKRSNGSGVLGGALQGAAAGAPAGGWGAGIGAVAGGLYGYENR